MRCLSWYRPHVIVDAIIAKKNIGLCPSLAPLTIGLGPGFSAPVDCSVVIETNRGHLLSRIITKGEASPNTHCPGVIMGCSTERVLRSPCSGYIHVLKDIGSHVEKKESVAILFESKDDYNEHISRISATELKEKKSFDHHDEPKSSLSHHVVEIPAKISGMVRGMLHEGFYVPRKGFKVGDIDPRDDSSYIKKISDKGRALSGSVVCVILKWWSEGKLAFK
ncbi:molybdenum hydroxylase [Aduncisulcus paluster]|uniref:Molybdenum hydroxylase n=1 Tax=Aduncisulcus paluster TaxID=2918883 RepID=A0ABQ5K3T0_9EUKA|nr:molybdenum hydroxylase [Aduncisulcus paluster]